MNNKFLNRSFLIIAYTFFLHFSAYSGMIIDEKNYVMGRNVIMLCILIYLLIINNRIPQLFNNKYCVCWYIFACIVCFSVFPLNVISGIKLICVPVMYFIIMQYDNEILYNVSVAMVVNGIWILLQSVQLRGLNIGIYYSGVFSNTNTFGASMACFFVGACCLFLYEQSRGRRTIILGIALIAFFFQLISFCRSALLTSLIIFSIVFFVISYASKNKVKMLIGYIFCILIVIGALIFKGKEILTYILLHVYKWGNTTNTLSSSRIDMWKQVLKHPTILGTSIEFHPHNNFMLVLYAYGICAGMLFAFLIFGILYKFWKCTKAQIDMNRFVACIFIVMFICIGSFEESLGFTGREWMVVGFVGLGYAINYLKKHERSSHIIVIKGKKL